VREFASFAFANASAPALPSTRIHDASSNPNALSDPITDPITDSLSKPITEAPCAKSQLAGRWLLLMGSCERGR